MPQRLVIDPVTRIEGHAKITIMLDDDGQVEDARFHVTEFRGFEKFCEGRPFTEMAGLTARICGICPVSHLLTAAKAGDKILAVQIPPRAEKLRRLMNLAQFAQSHALSFFHLSAPDFVLGMDADPAKRNVFGLIQQNPELARKGIRLRQFGQEVIEILGGKKVHPAWAVPGGVRSPLTPEGRDRILAWIPEALSTTEEALTIWKKLLKQFSREAQIFGNFPTLYMGLVGPDGAWEHYDGRIRFCDGSGNILADDLDPSDYRQYVGEAVEAWSYLKFMYYKPLGYPDGAYRVGPLARLNLCKCMGSTRADAELEEYRERLGYCVNSALQYHYARLIEIMACVELIEQIASDPDILDPHVRASAGVNSLVGVGCGEAPRGTLFHDYVVDEDGLIRRANLIIATGQNNLAMNRTVAQIARHYIRGPEVPEEMLNRVEAGIRAYDPCLSCATHAAGTMPLHVQLLAADGTMVSEVKR
jgi:NAD-reducing hydrogenase large subunit